MLEIDGKKQTRKIIHKNNNNILHMINYIIEMIQGSNREFCCFFFKYSCREKTQGGGWGRGSHVHSLVIQSVIREKVFNSFQK